jgi:long-chain fatty acid transport protein
VLLALLVAIPHAHAGGYYFSDSGIIATGRGGAWIAGANTQFAQQYNPAGLIRVEAPTINIGLSGVTQNIRFERACPSADRTDVEPCGPVPTAAFYDEVRNEAPPFLIPEIGFAMPIGDRVGFAFGFQSPFAPDTAFEEEGPQRYTSKQLTIYQFSVGPSVAVKLHEMFTLGLGLQYQFFQIENELDITIGGQDNPEGDVASSLKATDAFTPNLNGGLLFEPVKQVSVGISVQPPTQFNASGPLSIDFAGTALADNNLLNETSYTDDEIALSIKLPWVVRGGVAVRPIENLEIEAAAVWQDWSTMEDIAITDISIPLDSDSELVPETIDNDISLPAGLEDTISLRLGGEMRVMDELAVRAGGFYETSGLTPSEVSVQLYDTSKVQLATGGSLFLADQQLRIDAAFAWLFLQNLAVTNSNVVQVDSGEFPLQNGPLVVGNGNYESSGWTLGVGASWMFKKRSE